MDYMHEQMPSKVEHIVHIDQPYFFGEAQAGETPEAFGLARAGNWRRRSSKSARRTSPRSSASRSRARAA
jgi:hypothetical protein